MAKPLDASLWGTDPLYWTHLILLNVQVIKGLVPTGSCWEEVNSERARLGCNHALPQTLRVVGHAHLMGVLVRKTLNSQCAIFTIDDGTALVDCVWWLSQSSFSSLSSSSWSSDLERKQCQVIQALELGTTIRCLGRLEWPTSKFQSNHKFPTRRLVLNQPFVIVSSPSEEIRHWEVAMDLWDKVYSQPLPQQQAIPLPSSLPIAKSAKFGSELEQDMMHVLCQSSDRMPLVDTGQAEEIQAKFPTIFPCCFQLHCLAREETIAARLLLFPAVGATATKGDRQTELTNAIRHLCCQGQILMLDHPLNLFAVITHQHFIAPAICKALAKSPTPFISYTALLERVREDPRLHSVTAHRFDKSLSRLLDDSVVIEGEASFFSLFVMPKE
ncbi:hypothetical protein BASA81_002966 [Batrachochytrium salamandrivorans]|nr:hypothetical protein BASA81_002966 [Batrachochytrium salamandrivorans]